MGFRFSMQCHVIEPGRVRRLGLERRFPPFRRFGGGAVAGAFRHTADGKGIVKDIRPGLTRRARMPSSRSQYEG
mgnify:CR=1 FL=1